MKPLPLKIDNYLLERIQDEARQNGITRAEVVRTALVHYLTYREDLEDATLIRNRLEEPSIPESQALLKLRTRPPKVRH